MTSEALTLETLWEMSGFSPNEKQEEAIRAVEGPLFLAAGPGAGKTRVLLWRSINLIVFNDVDPDKIFLSTFTEKAAKQLKDGLHSLLNLVTSINGKQYDISRMYLGTVHSLCQRLLTERKFSEGRSRKRPPVLIDELDQYFYISNSSYFKKLLEVGGFQADQEDYKKINKFIANKAVASKHDAVKNCIAIFNRFSEEGLDTSLYLNDENFVKNELLLTSILKMYNFYLESLVENEKAHKVDFSLLQQVAYDRIVEAEDKEDYFKYVIVDEYQDTNTIQEKIFFKLSEKNTNICVVGDDDQALYRFRGATVENFVQFKQRLENFNTDCVVKRIDLDTNYRSTPDIVQFSQKYLNQTDWRDEFDQNRFYRLHDKIINPGRKTDVSHISLVKSKADAPEKVCEEIVQFIKDLKEMGKIEDYSQCAFLFPSIKNNTKVNAFMREFEKQDIPVYAPRATRFLEIEEASMMWGLLLLIFKKPTLGEMSRGGEFQDYRNWLKAIEENAKNLCKEDSLLDSYIKHKRQEIVDVLSDYSKLKERLRLNNVSEDMPISFSILEKLIETPGLSRRSQKNITNKAFIGALRRRIGTREAYNIRYVINRATSLDWTVLDLFYQLSGFDYFKNKFEIAENGDEGPICNLALVSQYLARFIDKNSSVITAPFLEDEKFSKVFFLSYTYSLYRLGESEYENQDDPFPKGRIPFLTIHQSKGLEFPVVVLGSLYKVISKKPDDKEAIMYKLIEEKKDGEPLDSISSFDASRVFYVGITRAQNLLVMPHYKGRGQSINQGFRNLFETENIHLIEDYNKSTLPTNRFSTQDIGKAYSYTGDFLNYKKCPRQYMSFRRLGFVPSRSQTMFFGTLVHKTIEDLHQYLILLREKGIEFEREES
ncbi:UvrD-helicase domain-containing protein [Halobacteriovorax sp. YZS-1-1]|uniref:UvrD-helicase domain-containing protein n=1 Tax=unclassified Halobacteriovorax TaxID=2639665 RepID=UPI00399B8B2A